MLNYFSKPKCEYCGRQIGLTAISVDYGKDVCSEHCKHAYAQMLNNLKRFEQFVGGSHWKKEENQPVEPKEYFDKVEKPEHYHKYELDTLTFLEKGFPSSVLEGFLIGNVIKYTQRYKLKNGQEDLEKVKFYSKRLAEFNETMVK